MMKVRYLVSLGVASVVLLGAVRTAGAKDKWFVLTEQTIKATDPSVRITAEDAKKDKGGRQGREDLRRGR